MTAHRPMIGALSLFLLTDPSMGQTPKSDAEATPPTAVESTASKPSIPQLPAKLDGRWESKDDTGKAIGSSTSIRIASQAEGKVTGTFTSYSAYAGTCNKTIDAPFQGTWDGTTLRLYVRREPECRNFWWRVDRGKEHFLEGRGASNPAFKMYYDEGR